MQAIVWGETVWHVGGIDPVALDLGFLKIHWYALAYIAGILTVFKLTPYLAKRQSLNINAVAIDNFFTWAVLGIILGGRLGYVLFYQPTFYLSNPMEILAIYRGGMSFHGGFLGVVFAGYMYCRKNDISWLSLTDLFVVSIPLGLLFGRLANFINGELWGRITDGTWGVVFANAGDAPRHPSQLYEGLLEGLVLFVVLYVLATRFNGFKAKGLHTGVFLMGYGLSRIFVEGFRQPDAFIGTFAHGTTLGQWLSLPMVVIGASLIRYGSKRNG